MKKQARLLTAAFIGCSFFIAVLMTGCSEHPTERAGSHHSNGEMIAGPATPLFLFPRSVCTSTFKTAPETELFQHHLLTGSSPLTSACLFVKKITSSITGK